MAIYYNNNQYDNNAQEGTINNEQLSTSFIPSKGKPNDVIYRGAKRDVTYADYIYFSDIMHYPYNLIRFVSESNVDSSVMQYMIDNRKIPLTQEYANGLEAVRNILASIAVMNQNGDIFDYDKAANIVKDINFNNSILNDFRDYIVTKARQTLSNYNNKQIPKLDEVSIRAFAAQNGIELNYHINERGVSVTRRDSNNIHTNNTNDKGGDNTGSATNDMAVQGTTKQDNTNVPQSGNNKQPNNAQQQPNTESGGQSNKKQNSNQQTPTNISGNAKSNKQAGQETQAKTDNTSQSNKQQNNSQLTASVNNNTKKNEQTTAQTNNSEQPSKQTGTQQSQANTNNNGQTDNNPRSDQNINKYMDSSYRYNININTKIEDQLAYRPTKNFAIPESYYSNVSMPNYNDLYYVQLTNKHEEILTEKGLSPFNVKLAGNQLFTLLRQAKQSRDETDDKTRYRDILKMYNLFGNQEHFDKILDKLGSNIVLEDGYIKMNLGTREAKIIDDILNSGRFKEYFLKNAYNLYLGQSRYIASYAHAVMPTNIWDISQTFENLGSSFTKMWYNIRSILLEYAKFKAQQYNGRNFEAFFDAYNPYGAIDEYESMLREYGSTLNAMTIQARHEADEFFKGKRVFLESDGKVIKNIEIDNLTLYNNLSPDVKKYVDNILGEVIVLKREGLTRVAHKNAIIPIDNFAKVLAYTNNLPMYQDKDGNIIVKTPYKFDPSILSNSPLGIALFNTVDPKKEPEAARRLITNIMNIAAKGDYIGQMKMFDAIVEGVVTSIAFSAGVGLIGAVTRGLMAARMIYAAATVAEDTAKVVQMGKQIAEMHRLSQIIAESSLIKNIYSAEKLGVMARFFSYGANAEYLYATRATEVALSNLNRFRKWTKLTGYKVFYQSRIYMMNPIWATTNIANSILSGELKKVDNISDLAYIYFKSAVENWSEAYFDTDTIRYLDKRAAAEIGKTMKKITDKTGEYIGDIINEWMEEIVGGLMTEGFGAILQEVGNLTGIEAFKFNNNYYGYAEVAPALVDYVLNKTLHLTLFKDKPLEGAAVASMAMVEGATLGISTSILKLYNNIRLKDYLITDSEAIKLFGSIANKEKLHFINVLQEALSWKSEHMGPITYASIEGAPLVEGANVKISDNIKTYNINVETDVTYDTHKEYGVTIEDGENTIKGSLQIYPNSGEMRLKVDNITYSVNTAALASMEVNGVDTEAKMLTREGKPIIVKTNNPKLMNGKIVQDSQHNDDSERNVAVFKVKDGTLHVSNRMLTSQEAENINYLKEEDFKDTGIAIKSQEDAATIKETLHKVHLALQGSTSEEMVNLILNKVSATQVQMQQDIIEQKSKQITTRIETDLNKALKNKIELRTERRITVDNHRLLDNKNKFLGAVTTLLKNKGASDYVANFIASALENLALDAAVNENIDPNKVNRPREILRNIEYSLTKLKNLKFLDTVIKNNPTITKLTQIAQDILAEHGIKIEGSDITLDDIVLSIVSYATGGVPSRPVVGGFKQFHEVYNNVINRYYQNIFMNLKSISKIANDKELKPIIDEGLKNGKSMYEIAADVLTKYKDGKYKEDHYFNMALTTYLTYLQAYVEDAKNSRVISIAHLGQYDENKIDQLLDDLVGSILEKDMNKAVNRLVEKHKMPLPLAQAIVNILKMADNNIEYLRDKKNRTEIIEKIMQIMDKYAADYHGQPLNQSLIDDIYNILENQIVSYDFNDRDLYTLGIDMGIKMIASNMKSLTNKLAVILGDIIAIDNMPNYEEFNKEFRKLRSKYNNEEFQAIFDNVDIYKYTHYKRTVAKAKLLEYVTLKVQEYNGRNFEALDATERIIYAQYLSLLSTIKRFNLVGMKLLKNAKVNKAITILQNEIKDYNKSIEEIIPDEIITEAERKISEYLGIDITINKEILDNIYKQTNNIIRAIEEACTVEDGKLPRVKSIAFHAIFRVMDETKADNPQQLRVTEIQKLVQTLATSLHTRNEMIRTLKISEVLLEKYQELEKAIEYVEEFQKVSKAQQKLRAAYEALTDQFKDAISHLFEDTEYEFNHLLNPDYEDYKRNKLVIKEKFKVEDKIAEDLEEIYNLLKQIEDIYGLTENVQNVYDIVAHWTSVTKKEAEFTYDLLKERIERILKNSNNYSDIALLHKLNKILNKIPNINNDKIIGEINGRIENLGKIEVIKNITTTIHQCEGKFNKLKEVINSKTILDVLHYLQSHNMSDEEVNRISKLLYTLSKLLKTQNTMLITPELINYMTHKNEILTYIIDTLATINIGTEVDYDKIKKINVALLEYEGSYDKEQIIDDAVDNINELINNSEEDRPTQDQPKVEEQPKIGQPAPEEQVKVDERTQVGQNFETVGLNFMPAVTSQSSNTKINIDNFVKFLYLFSTIDESYEHYDEEYIGKLKWILENLVNNDNFFKNEILPRIAEEYGHTLDAVKIAYYTMLTNLRNIIGEERIENKNVRDFLAAKQKEVDNLTSARRYENRKVLDKLKSTFDNDKVEVTVKEPVTEIVVENGVKKEVKKIVKKPTETSLGNIIYDVATTIIMETLGNSTYFAYFTGEGEKLKKQFKDEISQGIIYRVRYLLIDMLMKDASFVENVKELYRNYDGNSEKLGENISKLMVGFIYSNHEFTDKATFVINNIVTEFVGQDSIDYVTNSIFQDLLNDTKTFKRTCTTN